MPILEVVTQSAGLVSVAPHWVYIATNDTIAQVTATGYLNKIVQQGNYSFSESDMALVTTKTSPSATQVDVAMLNITHSGANWSLVTTGAPGSVTLPTVANHIIVSTNTTGALANLTGTAIQSGNLQAGLSGTAGYVASFPSTALKGSLRLTAVANTGDTVTTISNVAMGQASVISIPDPGTATASFVLDNGSTQIIATGNLQLLLGNFIAGATGGTASGGKFISYPVTTGNGLLQVYATNAGGAYTTSITNAVTTQTQVISIPNAGASTSSFVLTAASAAQTIVPTLNVTGGVTAGAAAGTAGTFTSYPTTTGNGSLIIQAINAGGAFNTTIASGTIGQSSVFTIPDPANAVARFLVGATATPFTTAHILASSGTGGLVADSGIATSNVQVKTGILAKQVASLGGSGGGPLTVTATGVTSASVICVSIVASSNTVSVSKVTPGTDNFALLLSADPGAVLTISYIAFIVAQ